MGVGLMSYSACASSPTHFLEHMVDKKMALLTGRSFLLKSRPYIFCRACISTTSARASNGSIEDLSNGKLYELRTYAIKPDKFGEFTKIMQEGYMLRTAHSKLIGYWSTDLGGVNEVVHIWEYGERPC